VKSASARASLAAFAVSSLLAARPLIGQVATEVPNISPVFEGWEANADGSFNLVFGYFNRSWESMPVVSIGPENQMAPGPQDQGQPTYFLPRRNHFAFRIRVPADFGTREIVWTLTSLGRTEKAYGSLKPDYVLDDMLLMSNIGAGGALSTSPGMVGNKAPALTIHGPRTPAVAVGEPLALSALVTDDDKPTPRNMPTALGGNYMLPNSAKGLRFAWFVYRGDGANVTFNPAQFKVWEDTRDGGNSPWSAGWKNPPIPPNNTWMATARFAAPGTYTIRGIAHDGGLSSVQDIVVTVR
jgi:hypothetical protein